MIENAIKYVKSLIINYVKELKEKAYYLIEEIKESKIKIKLKFVDSIATKSAIALQNERVR